MDKLDPTRESRPHLLAQAREAVGQATSCLQAPSADGMDRCRAALERAALSVQKFNRPQESNRPADGGPMLPAALELRRDVCRMATLLESAHTFHAGWRKARLELAGGYNPEGVPAPFAVVPQLQVEA